MCRGSEAGSYLRLIDFVYHLTLGLRVIKKKKKDLGRPGLLRDGVPRTGPRRGVPVTVVTVNFPVTVVTVRGVECPEYNEHDYTPPQKSRVRKIMRSTFRIFMELLSIQFE